MTNELEIDCDSADWQKIVKGNNKINFVVSETQLKKILPMLNNKIDDDGYIIDSSTKIRVQSKDGDDIRLEEVGGLLTGSKVFVKKNIASLSEHLIEKKSRNLD